MFAELMNVLYDKDHYKLALGQLAVCRNLVSTISRDYVRMLKYGDSLYRCKSLKRAALGRMATLLLRQKASLAYLEEVRKHLSRLPSIDPNTRTLLIAGYPNVGKSSFMNKITRADVEVQPYAFTTKSLFVGHTDYKFLRWQVIDTPGILDKPLEERNTIEMQAITALAHLQCCVLYFMDISEHCGWTIEQQVALFENIRPLFANKPLVIVVNKTDLVAWPEGLDDHRRGLIEKLAASSSAALLPMSSVAEQGLTDVKRQACELLLERRVEQKAKSAKKIGGVLNRLTVTKPAPRDRRAREVSIPPSVLEARARKAAAAAARDSDTGEGKDGHDEEDADEDEGDAADVSMADAAGRRKLQKEIQWEQGGPGVYSADFTEQYMLKNPEWRKDAIPEIMNGKNIADFVDPDIMRKLEELEREEEELERQAEAVRDLEDDGSDLDEEEKQVVRAIRSKKAQVVDEHRREKNKNRANIARKYQIRSAEQLQAGLEAKGYDVSKVSERISRKRGRSDADDDSDVDMADTSSSRAGGRAGKSRKTSATASPGDGSSSSTMRERRGLRKLEPTSEGFGNEGQRSKAKKLGRKELSKIQRKSKVGQRTESDRWYGAKLDKHMTAGKRGIGKTRSR